MKANNIVEELVKLGDPLRAQQLLRFFKTGPGEYGEGDIFLGITNPQQRALIKKYRTIPISEVSKLLKNKYHECRLTALLILVDKYKRASDDEKKTIFDIYISNTKYINNWDLVDLSAGYIAGDWLFKRDKSILFDLAKSDDLWERRIGMMSCFYFIMQGESKDAFEIIEILKYDKHDLIQKAVGWMLREIGKRCSRQELESWLIKDGQYKKLPRTMLRYSIEHFDDKKRKQYLSGLA